jgi:hypothetical protein
VPSQTRAKATGSGAKVKSKSGRRSPVNVRVKKGSSLPILPVTVAGILVALAIGLVAYGWANGGSSSGKPGTVAGIPCDHLEQTQVHYHAALQMVYQGNVVNIPGGIGITGSESAPSCYYWLHVHSAYTDVIHIESPATKTFTLGQFFQVWGAWSTAQGGPSEPLDSKHVSVFTLKPGQALTVYVDAGDGKGPQLYTGDPNAIVFRNHQVITVEIAPPIIAPPPAFTFPSGV